MKRLKISEVGRRNIVGGNMQPTIKTLPIDLIIEILSRLPVKSIAMSRCVSKQWKSLLRSPGFTKSFLTISSARPRILFTFGYGGMWNICSTPQPQNIDDKLGVVAADCHMGVTGYSGRESCVSVHGFVCLIYRRVIMGKLERYPVICNPSTCQLLALPKVRARKKHLRSFFGYDPIKKQFKVLCMTVTKYRQQVNSREHQVITVGKGEVSWRKMKCPFPHYPDQERDGICINGVLYYIARSNETSFIACFDVGSEEFRFIKMLEGSELTLISALLNYNGKLGAVVYGEGSHGEVWILDDIEKEIWSKHLFVFPKYFYKKVKSTWATDTGEIAWVLSKWTNPYYVFYYNLERKIARRVEIQGVEENVLKRPELYLAQFSVTNHVENVMFL